MSPPEELFLKSMAMVLTKVPKVLNKLLQWKYSQYVSEIH